MLMRLKQFLMGAVRRYLFKWYMENFMKLAEEVMEKQFEQLIESIRIARDSDVPVIMMINPATALGMAEFSARDPEEMGTKIEDEPKKDNPFSLVEDEDE